MAPISTLLPSGPWWLYASLLLICWFGFTAIRRRYFHPLSHVPGPFLWSTSNLPILYHNGIREGQLMHVLPKLHAKYGPVLRIAPNEVHLSDPTHYSEIYSSGYKYPKDPDFYAAMEGPIRAPVLLTVKSADEHRVRRGALNPFFSRKSVLELEEGIIKSKTDKLCGLIESCLYSTSPAAAAAAEGQKKRNKVFDIHNAIRAYAIDIITSYAYGSSNCWNQLDLEQLTDAEDFQESIRTVQVLFPWFQTFPVLMTMFGWIPDWFTVKVFPPFKKWIESLETVRETVTKVRKEIENGVSPERRTIFHELIDPLPLDDNEVEGKGGKFRPKKLSDIVVFSDAVNVTGAGADTTGSTIGRAIFEVISSEKICGKLRKELRDAFPDKEDINLRALEKLPYLTGVVKEALRLNPGLPGHLPRIIPSPGATFNSIPLPAGTSISMSAWMMHHDTVAFGSNPSVFDPERWIPQSEEDEERIRMQERCMVPFGKGSRNCLGQALAMAELYSTVGNIFWRFGDLVVEDGVTREDLGLMELFLGYHPRGARKLRVLRREGPV